MYQKILSLVIIGFQVSIACCQTVISDNLLAFMEDEIDAMPESGTNVYSVPSIEQFEAFQSGIDLLISENYSEASNAFNNMGHTLFQLNDNTGKTFYIATATDENNVAGGTLIYCPECLRERVILLAPHSIKDSNTGTQAVDVYYDLGSKWLMLNGTNRCNSITESSCDGSTSVCGGGSSPYPVSDVAHNSESLMQAATMKINEYYESEGKERIFFQLHGFNKSSRPSSFPDGVLSYGIRADPTAQVGYSTTFANRVAQVCNCEVGEYHFDTDITQLGGTTNTQGRYLNESIDPCEESGELNSGLFLHYEQSSHLRSNFNYLLQGLLSISERFELGVSREEFDFTIRVRNQELQYKMSAQSAMLTVYNSLGQKINEVPLNKKAGTVSLNVRPGIYFYQLTSENKYATGKFLTK